MKNVPVNARTNAATPNTRRQVPGSWKVIIMKYRSIRETEGGKYEMATEGTTSGVFALIWSLDFKFVTIFQEKKKKQWRFRVGEMYLSTSCTANTVSFLRAWTTDLQSTIYRLSFAGGNKRFHVVSRSSRPAMGTTQPPVQCVIGAIFPKVKRLTTRPYLVLRLRRNMSSWQAQGQFCCY